MAGLLEKLRRLVRRFIEPVALAAARVGLTPNATSALGFLAALLSAFLVVRGRLAFAAAFVFISGFMDVLDGAIARVTGRVTRFGGFLDSLLDRYSDVVVLSSVIYASLCQLVWGLAAITGSLLVSYARARGESLGVKMAGIGLAERAERLIIITLGLLFNAVNWAVILIAILAHITVGIRAFKAWTCLRGDRL